MNAVIPTGQGPWEPADDFPGYEFSRSASRVFLRCASCKKLVNQWPIYETQPLKFQHVCPSTAKEDLALKSEVEAATIYSGNAAFDGHGNVTISVEEFNELLAYKRKVIGG